jgi:hypothetical protein
VTDDVKNNSPNVPEIKRPTAGLLEAFFLILLSGATDDLEPQT